MSAFQPQMLSREATDNEVNWSLGTYVTNEEIEKAFGITGLPRPWGVAPNQPFTGQFYYTWGFLPLLALMVIAIAMLPLAGITKTVHTQEMVLSPMASVGAPQAAFSSPFELKGNRNVRITAGAQVDNSWADLDFDLINDQSQEVESVNVPIEYYSGTDSDGAWSEGGRSTDATLSSLPGGKYTLRVEGTWEKWQSAMPVSIKVEQGVTRGVNFGCALLMLAIMPLLGLFRKFSFESARWRDSMFTTSSSE